jgi:hypothetical protein
VVRLVKARTSQCAYCQAAEQQIKIGLKASGSTRFRHRICKRIHAPEPAPNGYTDKVRHQAVKLYPEGINARRMGRNGLSITSR